jgi:thymidylate synthase ThyX
MKVTLVSITATEAAHAAGRPALTPELLAATGARYSRNNEGLDTILAKIDPCNQDASVDSIFNMIDYGHQSIADMAPISMFIDNVTIWLAYYIWTLTPTAGGQESSTRYIQLSTEALPAIDLIGISAAANDEWQTQSLQLFQAYNRALRLWENLIHDRPELARIPNELLRDTSPKSRKIVSRMLRNFAFDRARYLLPVAARTNIMLVMNARAWTTLLQHLLSHPLPEANTLGIMIRDELKLSAPRMLRHATIRASIQNGIRDEFLAVQQLALQNPSPHLQSTGLAYEHPPTPYLDVLPPPGIDACTFARDLAFHEDRYSWVGPQLKRVAVRFGWQAMAFAEIRDLNRHRTGNKYCPLLPVGFYAAKDQLPEGHGSARRELQNIALTGFQASQTARQLLESGNPAYVYYKALGTQIPFEHLTTGYKFCYEVELRSGLGSHYRYAQHIKDIVQLWYQHFPCTLGLILEGTAEPE